MSKANKTKYAILGILNQKPASGYDIKKFCDESISYFWNENYGHIYPVLAQLVRDGLIEKNTESSESKPARHVYTITTAGKSMLHTWLTAETDYQPVRNEFLLKMVFSHDIPVSEIIQNLENELEKADHKLKELQTIEKHFHNNPGFQNSKSMPFWLSSVRFYILNISSRVEWCQETIRRLKTSNSLH